MLLTRNLSLGDTGVLRDVEEAEAEGEGRGGQEGQEEEERRVHVGYQGRTLRQGDVPLRPQARLRSGKEADKNLLVLYFNQDQISIRSLYLFLAYSVS